MGNRLVRPALRIERDLTVNHELVTKVMEDLGSTGLLRRKTRRRNLINVRTSSHLDNRNFTANQPNHLWVTDITERPLIAGNVYACLVFDVTLRKAVGWAVARRPETALVNSAFFMVHATRRPVSGGVILGANADRAPG